MEYLFKNNFDNTEKVVNEKDLRDLYLQSINGIIFGNKDSGNNKIIQNLEQEKKEVYTCDINKVIKTLEEDNYFYEIKKYKGE